MMRKTRWQVAPFHAEAAEQLAQDLRLPRVIASILVERGLATPDAAQAFLHPSVEQLHDPLLMPGMDRAVARLQRALAAREQILIYGDYDVDGVTSTAMLVRALSALGAQVNWHIPHRVRDGYGLNQAAIRQVAAAGAKVVLTVDTGISAHAPVALARELGMDVIISDHHEPPPELPDALAILNPKLPGSPYPFKELAGVGVAFKLLTALVRAQSPAHEASMQRRFLDFVALGTIADVAPLVDENRVLARLGLEQLQKTRSVGLRALMTVAGLGNRPLNTHDVGFGLGPRLNAGGRLDTAKHALQLLLTKDDDEARRLATQLEVINRERQDEEAAIVDEARARLGFDFDRREFAIVLASPAWHVGVVGIAASRIVDAYHRPTILLCLEGDEARGSGRSIEPFHLYDALAECKDLLTRFGGHRQAAGMTLPAAAVDEFRRRFAEIAAARLTADDLIPTTRVDAELAPAELTEELLFELERLAPFGLGNPRPVFGLRGVALPKVSTVGGGKHLKLRVKAGDHHYDAMWWRSGEFLPALENTRRADLAFTPEFNDFGGYRAIQLNVRDVQPLGGALV